MPLLPPSSLGVFWITDYNGLPTGYYRNGPDIGDNGSSTYVHISTPVVKNGNFTNPPYTIGNWSYLPNIPSWMTSILDGGAGMGGDSRQWFPLEY